LFELFLNNILPIFLIAGAGFLVSKFFNLQPRLLAQVTLYLFTPCLTFNLIFNNKLLGQEIVIIFVVAMLVMSLVGLVTWGIGRLLKLDRKIMAAVLLCAMFMNAGNFGIPLLGFSFGEKAQAYGSLYFVSMAVLTNTVGIAIASSGKSTLRQSLINLLRFPALYAVGVAGLFITFDWSLPLPITRSIDILSGAAIPCMLVLLGMQLQVARWNGHYKALSLALVMRMLVAPILALGLSQLFNLSGSLLQAAITESSMPPAVMNALLATEYDAEPSFATFVILTGTLLSPFTLTPLIKFLGA
jgi:predicted permease